MKTFISMREVNGRGAAHIRWVALRRTFAQMMGVYTVCAIMPYNRNEASRIAAVSGNIGRRRCAEIWSSGATTTQLDTVGHYWARKEIP